MPVNDRAEEKDHTDTTEQPPDGSSDEKHEFIVDWEDENQNEKPINWTTRRKVFNFGLIIATIFSLYVIFPYSTGLKLSGAIKNN